MEPQEGGRSSPQPTLGGLSTPRKHKANPQAPPAASSPHGVTLSHKALPSLSLRTDQIRNRLPYDLYIAPLPLPRPSVPCRPGCTPSDGGSGIGHPHRSGIGPFTINCSAMLTSPPGSLVYKMALEYLPSGPCEGSGSRGSSARVGSCLRAPMTPACPLS